MLAVFCLKNDLFINDYLIIKTVADSSLAGSLFSVNQLIN